MGREGKQPQGLLLEGDFGTGKSHWLDIFRHQALENHFVCSTVVLNKETPLSALSKVFRACVDSAVIPAVGPALEEIAHDYDIGAAARFRQLAGRLAAANPRYGPALRGDAVPVRQRSLRLYSRKGDCRVDRQSDAGERPACRVARNRRAKPLYRRRPRAWRHPATLCLPHPLLPCRRLQRLGDSPRRDGDDFQVQRAGARTANPYLAQLLGLVKGVTIPWLASVFTITRDYTGQALDGRKNDLEMVPAKLQGTKDDEHANAAGIGMMAIKSRGVPLRPPTQKQVEDIYQRVRDLYAEAYGWTPPDIASVREYAASTGMRQYVRSWINAWDLRRLYDVNTELVVETVTQSYDEDADMTTTEADDDVPQIVLKESPCPFLFTTPMKSLTWARPPFCISRHRCPAMRIAMARSSSSMPAVSRWNC